MRKIVYHQTRSFSSLLSIIICIRFETIFFLSFFLSQKISNIFVTKIQILSRDTHTQLDSELYFYISFIHRRCDRHNNNNNSIYYFDSINRIKSIKLIICWKKHAIQYHLKWKIFYRLQFIRIRLFVYSVFCDIYSYYIVTVQFYISFAFFFYFL